MKDAVSGSWMKAVRIHQYGGPEVLMYEDAPKPTIKADQVLIRVHAASVNPVDWKMRRGYLKERMPFELPVIPGWDAAGVVVAVGSAVKDFVVGDAVFGREEFAGTGAYAEYYAMRASVLARKPAALDDVLAAAIPIAGLTAWQSLFEIGDLQAGQTLLVQGAAGGVGTFAVQLAKWKGARVIGTASAKNANLLREIGVDRIIDYNATRFEDVVKDVDFVFDTVGGETGERSLNVIKSGGTLVTIASQPNLEVAKERNIRAAGMLAQPNRDHLTKMADLITAGKVKPIVSTVLPLAEARKAHEMSETGHTIGKIVLKIR